MEQSDFSTFGAVLLDSESQILATGEAQLWSSQNRGILSIRDIPSAELLHTILKDAIVLKMSDGKVVKVRNIEFCSDYKPCPHFHFDLV